MSNLPLELCKRLRDEAGFPQRGRNPIWRDDDKCDCPNLGELLDFALSKWPDCYVDMHIKQTTAEAQLWTKDGNRLGIATGETPAIAMANLILEATHD